MNKKEELQQKLIYFAKKHLNKPYKYGAKLYEAPKVFDCSSFTQYLYQRININLPRTTLDQAHLGKKVNFPREELQIGDLIFIKGSWGHYDPKFSQGIGHVAMYVGDNKIVHAKWQKKNAKVKIESAQNLLKRKDLVVIKRIIK